MGKSYLCLSICDAVKSDLFILCMYSHHHLVMPPMEELHTLRTTWYDNLPLWMLFVQDVASLNTFFQSNFSATPEEKQLSVSGKNWGEVDLNGIVYLPLHLMYSFCRHKVVCHHIDMSVDAQLIHLKQCQHFCLFLLVWYPCWHRIFRIK